MRLRESVSSTKVVNTDPKCALEADSSLKLASVPMCTDWLGCTVRMSSPRLLAHQLPGDIAGSGLVSDDGGNAVPCAEESTLFADYCGLMVTWEEC